MSAVGSHLCDAIDSAAESSERLRIGYPDGDAALAAGLGAAYGHAFRAVELAYDLGQLHLAAAVYRALCRAR